MGNPGNSTGTGGLLGVCSFVAPPGACKDGSKDVFCVFRGGGGGEKRGVGVNKNKFSFESHDLLFWGSRVWKTWLVLTIVDVTS